MSQCEKTCEFYEACHQSMQRQGETDWQDTTEGTRARQLARVAKYKAEHPESEKKDPMSNDHEECPDCAADLAALQERQRLGMLSGTRIRCVRHTRRSSFCPSCSPQTCEFYEDCQDSDLAINIPGYCDVLATLAREEPETPDLRRKAWQVYYNWQNQSAAEGRKCQEATRVRQLARVTKYKAKHPDSKETLLQAAGEMLALCAQWAEETRTERARFSSLRLALCEVLSADEAEKIRAEERVAGLRGDRLDETRALVGTMLRAAGVSETDICQCFNERTE